MHELPDEKVRDENRRRLLTLLARWSSQQWIRDRRHVQKPELQVVDKHRRIALPVPESCGLLLSSRLSDEEIAFLRGGGFDREFTEAVLSLSQRFVGEPASAQIKVGLDQLPQLTDSVSLPSQGPPRLRFTGALRPEIETVLRRWQGISNAGATLAALLAALERTTLRASFDPQQGAPNIPSALAGRLRAEGNELLLQSLLLSDEQDGALRALQEAAPNQTVRTAAAQLREHLDPASARAVVVEVPIAAQELLPRPELLPPELDRKLLIGRWQLRCYGWLTIAEAAALAELAGADRDAIVRLYADSMRAGLAGGRLELRARRAQSGTKSGRIEAKEQV